MRLMLAVFLVIFCEVAFAQNAQLPVTVVEALQAESVPLDNVSIYVQRIDTPQALLTYQADVPRNPASVMKLVTSYAALDLLGPSYRWKTQFYGLNLPQQGKLQGGLWVKGSGDPALNTAHLAEVAGELQQKFNLNEICCEILLDNSAYAPQNFDAAAFDGKPYRAYNAPAEALMVNQQAIRLQLIPSNEKVTVVAYPNWSLLIKRIDIKPIAGDCGDWKNGLQIKREGRVLSLSGEYPVSCGDKYLDVNWQGAEYVGGLFYSAWEQAGGRWTQSDKTQIRLLNVPENAVLLTEHTSPTLAEILREMNKTSNNVMARALYLSLSRVNDASQVASTAKSEQVLKTWLQGKGLNFSELVLENGAGLSRQERISASHLGVLLGDAFRSPFMAELSAALPIYGVDGSLSKRKDSGLYGRAHLKTGSLENVRSIAGYVLDAKGRYWSVVFIANGVKAGATKPAQDALLNWVYLQD
ncbi:MAG: D-alanyl-D-alanine carboxypeptidase/D-alanyl-D-alanine-endopeptidase [Pseudomonadota bacterium]|jgi:D-alanyl-D-alanine carboxypeptidase/D-alanyl-D-alanine-endopeptidase (penicillin-binding protein 4)